MIASSIRNIADRLLRIPELKEFEGSDFDSPQAAVIEKKILQRKKALQTLYYEYSRPFIESARDLPPDATILEIGSGTSPLKWSVPNLLCTDVVRLGWLDIVCSAYSLPFEDNSVDRIFLMFVWHHLGRLEDFLDEARRCLKPGGEIVVVDPAITLFSRVYYKIHVDQMDVRAEQWGFDGEGRLSDSNIALAWIALFRDRDRFERLYPEFIIEKVSYNTCISFLLTGGFRIRQLLPSMVIKAVFNVENWVIRNITRQLATTMTVTIRKME